MEVINNWIHHITASPRQRQTWTVGCAIVSTIGVSYASYQLYKHIKSIQAIKTLASSSKNLRVSIDFPAEDNPHDATQHALNHIRAGELTSVGALVHFLRGNPNMEFDSVNNANNNSNTNKAIRNAFRARVSLYYIQFLQESYLPATFVSKAHEVERNMFTQLMQVDLALRHAEVERATPFDNNNVTHTKLLEELWSASSSTSSTALISNSESATTQVQKGEANKTFSSNSVDNIDESNDNTKNEVSAVTLVDNADVQNKGNKREEHDVPIKTTDESSIINNTNTGNAAVIADPASNVAKLPFKRLGPHWNDLGFQADDPVTDLRGGGVFALRQLVHFAQTHPTALREMIEYNKKVQEHGKDHWYLLAVVSIHLSAQILLQRDHALSVEHLEVLYDTIRLSPEQILLHTKANKDSTKSSGISSSKLFSVISRELLAKQLNVKLSSIHDEATKTFWEENVSDGEAGLMLLHHALLLHFKECWERDEPHVMEYNTFMAEKVFSTFFSDKWRIPKSLYTPLTNA